MSIGKMSFFINICEAVVVKDKEGFAKTEEHIVANTRAYKEARHGTETWKNRAAFSEATCLFRFRIIPGLTVTPSHTIICDVEHYRILSVDDVRNRKMYVECLADIIKPTMR